MRLDVQTQMELDSLQAIVHMVASGLGVAVVLLSDRTRAALPGLVCLPFGTPQLERKVVLLEREDRRAGRLANALADAVRAEAGSAAIHEKNLG